MNLYTQQHTFLIYGINYGHCIIIFTIIKMIFSKLQSYNLTPDEYLNRFQTPHSERDAQDALVLEQILERYNQNNQSKLAKEKAVSELSALVRNWMESIVQDWNKQHEQNAICLQDWGYGLKIFGSYSLKTNSFDGDIDIICVVPQFFSRQRHFFTILSQQLKKNTNIKQLFSIPDAIVPLIKLSLYDVQIDLLISRISLNFLKENPDFFQGNINSKTQTSFINEKQLRSINGFRTSLYLKNNIKNYKNYQVTLKAIKMWANNKGIYSQIYGYLGGAALSILLAKICQLYPNYSPLQLLDRFFFIYANWVWTLPVCIQKCSIDDKVQGGMGIYTPLQPHMNAAHYVSKITCHITRKQLKLASNLIKDINKKKKEWKDLFTPINFFQDYRNFIQLTVMGEKIQDFIAWKGAVESKIRKFIKFMQIQVQPLHLIEIHPYPRNFPSKHANYKYCHKYYFGFKCQINPNLNDYGQIDFAPSVRNFLQLLQNYSSIEKVPKQLNIGFSHVYKKNIDPQIIKGLKPY